MVPLPSSCLSCICCHFTHSNPGCMNYTSSHISKTKWNLNTLSFIKTRHLPSSYLFAYFHVSARIFVSPIHQCPSVILLLSSSSLSLLSYIFTSIIILIFIVSCWLLEPVQFSLHHHHHHHHHHRHYCHHHCHHHCHHYHYHHRHHNHNHHHQLDVHRVMLIVRTCSVFRED